MHTIRAERVGKQGLILQRTEGIKHILLSKSSKILPLQYGILCTCEPKVKYFDRPMLRRKLQCAINYGLVSIKVFIYRDLYFCIN